MSINAGALIFLAANMIGLGRILKWLFSKPATPHPPVQSGPTPLTELNRPTEQRPAISHQDRPSRIVSIVLLGHNKFGETFFAQLAHSECDQTTNRSTSGITNAPTSYFELPNMTFELIDAPDFNTPGMSSVEAFTKLTDYFLHVLHKNIAGVVYIHRAGDSLTSKTFVRKLSILFDVFLGDSGLSRLTVLVVPDKSTPQTVVSGSATNLSSASVFRTARAKGAKFVDSALDEKSIQSVLMSYSSQEPVLLRIQQESVQSLRSSILARIEEILKGGQNQNQPSANQGFLQSDNSLSESNLEKKDQMIVELSRAREKVEQQLVDSQGETAAVRQQLERTQKEYASLRSQLQLHENVEQRAIVQTLKDLNRNIDDLSRSISQHVVDNYITKAFGKEPNEVTSLDVRHLSELKKLLSHAEGKPSLVISSKGTGMQMEDLLDYGLRNLLCKHLFERIFHPFHPAADPSQHETLSMMYSVVQREEPQPVAARWRASCFKSIRQLDGVDIVVRQDRLVQHFLDESVSPLLGAVFGDDSGVELASHHFETLRQVYRTAWDWNSTLKADVIVLGDFHPTYYVPADPFDPNLMNEFDSTSHEPASLYIMGTLGLGLVSFRAVGGGHPPEEIVVLKATVAMESLYA